MPTAAKLVAAVLWGALAWYVSQLIKPLFPPGSDVGWFAEINAVIGVVLGWRVAGSRAGASWLGAISYGLTATVAVVFWGLFLQSFAKMVGKSTITGAYDGPVDAVVGVFEMMVEHGRLMIDPTVIGALVVGGVLAGLLTEWTARNFS